MKIKFENDSFEEYIEHDLSLKITWNWLFDIRSEKRLEACDEWCLFGRRQKFPQLSRKNIAVSIEFHGLVYPDDNFGRNSTWITRNRYKNVNFIRFDYFSHFTDKTTLCQVTRYQHGTLFCNVC